MSLDPIKISEMNEQTDFDPVEDWLTTVDTSEGQSAKARWPTIQRNFANDVIYVPPSGDASGVTDADNVEAAIAELRAKYASEGSTFRPQPMVLLSGMNYYSNRSIDLGPGAGNYPISLQSTHHSRWNYTGPQTDEYMFEVTGAPYSPTARLKGLYMVGYDNIRGILFQGQTYLSSLENVLVYVTRGVGVDCVSSWYSKLKQVHIWYPRGVGLRTWRCFAQVNDQVRVGHCSGTDWPDPTDSSVTDDQGNPVRTLTTERSAHHINSVEVTFRDMMYEGNTLITDPLVHISQNSRACNWTGQVYIEANDNTNEYVRIQGAGTATSKVRHFRFHNVKTEINDPCETFIRCHGFTGDVHVRQIHGDSLTGGVIIADGGEHHNLTVEDSAVGLDKPVTVANGGVVHSGTPNTFGLEGAVIIPVEGELAVAPSGDLTGATDHTAVQDALNAVATNGGTVRLNGGFNINNTLVIPAGARLQGDAGIFWRGAASSSDYMVECQGTNGIIPKIENITLWCQDNARGIFFNYNTYMHMYDRVTVRDFYEVGADLIDCYGSQGGMLRVRDGNGIGIRTWRCNSGIFGTWDVRGCNDANFPSPTDTTVQVNGKTIQTPAAYQAAMVLNAADHALDIRQDTMIVDNLVFEANTFGATPLLSTCANTMILRNIRFEQNDTSDIYALVDAGTDTHYGHNIFFQNVQTINGTANSLVEIQGNSHNIIVQGTRSFAGYLSSSVIRLNGGVHSNPTIRDHWVWGIPGNQFVEAINSATWSYKEALYTPTLSDTDAPLQSIYYSTTQGALVWKDANGDIRTVSVSVPI